MTSKSITKKCELCNKEFQIEYKDKKFCSVECYRLHQKSGNYKIDKLKTGIMIPCKNCSKDFYVPKKRSETQSNHYCSRECYLKYIHNNMLTKVHIRKSGIIFVICSKCGKEKELTPTGVSNIKKGQELFYCNDKCRSKRDDVLICKVCSCKFCSIQYRKSNNKKGFIIVRPKRNTCSSKCLKEFYRKDQDRKDKISKAFSGSNHPNYVNGASYNERIRKTDIKENFGKRDKKEVFKKFNNKCFKCGSLKNLCIDHHLPFSRGGLLTFSNCVILCKSCNSRKNAKMPEDFYTNKELMKLEKMGISENSLFSMRY